MSSNGLTAHQHAHGPGTLKSVAGKRPDHIYAICVMCKTMHCGCRREAIRFRKGMEESQEEVAKLTLDNKKLTARLDAAESEVAAVSSFARKRLARLRWRNSFATMGTWSQQSAITSGGFKSGLGHLMENVMMLEKMTAAVLNVERRKAAWGRSKEPEHYDISRPNMSDMVQVRMVWWTECTSSWVPHAWFLQHNKYSKDSDCNGEYLADSGKQCHNMSLGVILLVVIQTLCHCCVVL